MSQLMFPLCVLFSSLLTAYQFSGQAIDCMVQGGIPDSMINNYCWTHGTYTVKDMEHITRRPPTEKEKQHMLKYDHPGYIYPGVRTAIDGVNTKEYHVFYQYVCFMVFVQGVLFYIPRFIWRNLIEGGKLKFLTSDMNLPATDNDTEKKRVARLSAGFKKFKSNNNKYAFGFLLMEILNLVNVVAQFILNDIFLNGNFLDLGARLWIYYSQYEYSWDPLDQIFPKMTKCQFRKHGVGGQIQIHDALCNLPQNVLNEKIYVIMWLLLVPLGIISAIAVFYRLHCIFVPLIRIPVLSKSHNKWREITKICLTRPYGDWFLLQQMSKNVDIDTFDKFLDALRQNDVFVKEYSKKRKCQNCKCTNAENVDV